MNKYNDTRSRTPQQAVKKVNLPRLESVYLFYERMLVDCTIKTILPDETNPTKTVLL